MSMARVSGCRGSVAVGARAVGSGCAGRGSWWHRSWPHATPPAGRWQRPGGGRPPPCAPASPPARRLASRAMTDQPWQGDACSLVDAFRSGTLSPAEALEASLAAIDASELNAFTHLDADAARAAAAGADVSLPFGGVPIGVKELDQVAGWPYTEASLVFARPGGRARLHHGHPAPGGRRGPGGRQPPPRSSVASTTPTRSSTAPPAIPGTRSGPREAPPAARRRRCPAAWCRSPPAATGAARSGSRPATPACSG